MKNTRSRWKSWIAIVFGFVAVTLGGFRNTAWSEDAAPPASNDLEQRVRILERKLEVADETAAAKDKETASVNAGVDGFRIQSPDKAFVLKIRALLQTDSRFFLDDQSGNETDQFLVRRLRPILEGTLYSYFNFRLTPDFASNGKTTIYDAYLDIAPWTYAKLRIGKFKPPIGLEHLQSDEYLEFAERGLPSDLVPNRDTGIQLFGELFNGIVSYATAFTNGVGDNNTNAITATPVASDTDNNDGKEGTGRIVLKPFKNVDTNPFQGLGLGFAGSYARQAITNPTYNSPAQLGLFTAAASASPDGEKIRLAPDISWYYHSLGIFGDAVQSSQVYRVGRVRSRVNNQAWQGVASYVVTGEDASYTGVKPRKLFDPKNGTWGAFEVAARYGVLYLDPANFDNGVTTRATSVQRATDLGFGLNWYLNNAVRLTTDFDETTFNNGGVSGTDRQNEEVVVTRAQLLF